MTPFKYEVKNNNIEESKISIERMIETEDSAIYSDHRGIVFAIFKEDAFSENEIPNENQNKRSGNRG